MKSDKLILFLFGIAAGVLLMGVLNIAWFSPHTEAYGRYHAVCEERGGEVEAGGFCVKDRVIILTRDEYEKESK